MSGHDRTPSPYVPSPEAEAVLERLLGHLRSLPADQRPIFLDLVERYIARLNAEQEHRTSPPAA